MSAQPPLFDHTRPPESLPFQGRSVEALAAGARAALSAAGRRGSLASRYLELLLRAGAQGLTDHEAATALHCPVSSICSTRAGSQVRGQIAPHGHRRGPYQEINTVYVLRIVLGERVEPRP